MTNMNSITCGVPKSEPLEEIEEIDIDFLLQDVLIIKAESLKDRKIFNYAVPWQSPSWGVP